MLSGWWASCAGRAAASVAERGGAEEHCGQRAVCARAAAAAAAPLRCRKVGSCLRQLPSLAMPALV